MIIHDKDLDKYIVEYNVDECIKGVPFTKLVNIMDNNIKVHKEAMHTILNLSSNGRKVLDYIYAIVPYNNNVITIDRKDALIYLNSSDRAMITKGIKELLETGIIRKYNDTNKNKYILSMGMSVYGNVDVMVRRAKEEAKEREKEEKENAFSLRLKQININRNGNKN